MSLPDLWNLDGRVAIVSGAGSPAGIGFAAARALGELGAGIVLTATSGRVLERAAELRASGITATGLVARLDDEEQVDALAADLAASGIRPTIVVNNAGMIATGDPEMLHGDATMSLADWNASLAMNLTTAFLLTRAMLPGMREVGWGRVICVSSVSGPLMASRGDVGYAAAKAGMLGYVRALAVDEALFGITARRGCSCRSSAAGAPRRSPPRSRGSRRRARPTRPGSSSRSTAATRSPRSAADRPGPQARERLAAGPSLRAGWRRRRNHDPTPHAVTRAIASSTIPMLIFE